MDPDNPDKIKTRAATITVTRNCTFAIMNRKDYLEHLTKIEAKQTAQLTKFFRQIPFMKLISNKVLNTIKL
jgi:hypothetical protein